ncbi:hypothetical protein [Altererythrobacter sp. Root672]|nr:hypothetical protein [Altererythrobacter sp. Root672]
MTRVIENTAALLIAVLLATISFAEVASVPVDRTNPAIAAPILA